MLALPRRAVEFYYGEVDCEASSDTESETESTASSDAEGDEASEAVRRRPRGCRSLLEKSTEWKKICHPEVQRLFRSSFKRGEVVPLPEALLNADQLSPKSRLAAPFNLKRRATSPNVPLPISTDQPYTRDDDGDLVCYVHSGFGGECQRTRTCTLESIESSQPLDSDLGPQAVTDAIKKRANEICMHAYVTGIAVKNSIRHANSDARDGDVPVPDRKAVTLVANRFDTTYGQVQDAIAPLLCFDPPRRSRTVAIGLRDILHESEAERETEIEIECTEIDDMDSEVSEGNSSISSRCCDRCSESYLGFGTTCPSCRRSGRHGSVSSCSACGAFFSGFGNTCEDCRVNGSERPRAQTDGFERSNPSGYLGVGSFRSRLASH